MDFWDAAKLMARRWRVTVPALLLTVAAAVYTSLSVEPDYQVTGHVALVGPSIQRATTNSTTTRVNPWSSEALADAATIRLQGKAVANELADEGYRGEWGAVVAGRLPVIRLEVVAEQPEEAQATLQRLREVIDEEARALQGEYNVPSEEQITTVSYDGGETVEPVTGRMKRALLVVVAAGLIMTMGTVVAVDAIARRRHARTGDPPPVDPPPVDPPVRTPPRARYPYGSGTSASKAPAAPVAGRPNGDEPALVDNSEEERTVRLQFTERPVSMSPPPDPVSPPYDPASMSPPSDSTIVLPLSNASFMRQQAGDQDHPTRAHKP